MRGRGAWGKNDTLLHGVRSSQLSSDSDYDVRLLFCNQGWGNWGFHWAHWPPMIWQTVKNQILFLQKTFHWYVYTTRSSDLPLPLLWVSGWSAQCYSMTWQIHEQKQHHWPNKQTLHQKTYCRKALSHYIVAGPVEPRSTLPPKIRRKAWKSGVIGNMLCDGQSFISYFTKIYLFLQKAFYRFSYWRWNMKLW